MAQESVHQKLSRVRKPHVHITYEVETEGAVEVKELPFVVGVIGDFSGNPTTPQKPITDRNFINIDRDNFDEVMRRMKPELNFRVQNTLQGDGSEIPVHLEFNGIDDFEPANVAQQVEPLRQLLNVREKLKTLLTKMDINPDLEKQMEEIIQNTELAQKLSGELGADGSSAEPK